MIRSAKPPRSVSLSVALGAGMAAAVTVLIMLCARRNRHAAEAMTFERLALRNEHYAG